MLLYYDGFQKWLKASTVKKMSDSEKAEIVRSFFACHLAFDGLFLMFKWSFFMHVLCLYSFGFPSDWICGQVSGSGLLVCFRMPRRLARSSSYCPRRRPTRLSPRCCPTCRWRRASDAASLRPLRRRLRRARPRSCLARRLRVRLRLRLEVWRRPRRALVMMGNEGLVDLRRRRQRHRKVGVTFGI